MTDEQEKPPLFRSWNAWYTVVIVLLVVVMLGLYFFSAYFS